MTLDLNPAPEMIELDVSGMTCAACANRVEKALNKLDGVTATVNYATARAHVTGAAGVDTPTRALSGGNMQKLILGRALMGEPQRAASPAAGGAAPPRLIVASQPTWGLDIGAVAYVHQQLLDACAAGAAVLLISEDLEEIFALADRIAVMHHGRLTEALPAAQWTPASIGLAMAGGARQAESGAQPPQAASHAAA